MRSVLVTGGTGQLGTAIAALDWDDDIRLLKPPRALLDLGSAESVSGYFSREDIALVINAGAFTAVDQAEARVADAFSVNAQGPALLADATRAIDVPLIQISTDYVFSGNKLGPYSEEDQVGPLSVYGASKLAGEMATHLGNPRSVVLRTAWVISAHGTNFLKTMRRLAITRNEVSVVADQIGCPTSAADIAAAVRLIAMTHLEDHDAPTGTYHFTNGGIASWCDLAARIFALEGGGTVARPITTADYPTAAPRPANSVLSKDKIARDFGITPRDWTVAVDDIMRQLQSQQYMGNIT